VKYLLLVKLWNYIRGYVIIIIEGYFIEKFINICLHRQIFLWDIRRKSGRKIILKVSIKGFKLLRPIARKTRCRVKVVSKKGLPFLLHRYRQRKTFLAGAFIFLALLFFMSSFIWSVEISGNETIDTQVIEEKLKEYGMAPGKFKYGIDTKKAVSDLMIDIKELSWIGIELKGTRVKVSLRERIPIPEILPKNKPCSIYAAKDAIINRIIVKEGIETVSAGDTVKKGQEVISGRVPVANEKDTFRYVHAMGTVEARTWYEATAPVEKKYIEEIRTGKKYSNYTLSIFSNDIKLFHKNPGFEFYEKEDTSKILSIGKDLVFPFGVKIENYYEITKKTVEVSEEEAKNRASEKAFNKLMEEIPENARIIKTRTVFEEDTPDGIMLARVTCECLEDIGVKKAIGGN